MNTPYLYDDGKLSVRSTLGRFLGIDEDTVSAMYLQRAPTPDAIRRKLELLAGPHGRVFAMLKVKELGLGRIKGW